MKRIKKRILSTFFFINGTEDFHSSAINGVRFGAGTGERGRSYPAFTCFNAEIRGGDACFLQLTCLMER